MIKTEYKTISDYLKTMKKKLIFIIINLMSQNNKKY